MLSWYNRHEQRAVYEYQYVNTKCACKNHFFSILIKRLESTIQLRHLTVAYICWLEFAPCNSFDSTATEFSLLNSEIGKIYCFFLSTTQFDSTITEYHYLPIYFCCHNIRDYSWNFVSQISFICWVIFFLRQNNPHFHWPIWLDSTIFLFCLFCFHFSFISFLFIILIHFIWIIQWKLMHRTKSIFLYKLLFYIISNFNCWYSHFSTFWLLHLTVSLFFFYLRHFCCCFCLNALLNHFFTTDNNHHFCFHLM